MKRLMAAVLVAIVVVAFAVVAWAQEVRLPKREIKGIETLAGIYFPNTWVTFYKNRIFVRDHAGYLLTFKIIPDQYRVRKDEIDGRPGYEAVAALFLISVSDYLKHPDRGPLGLGNGLSIKKIGDQDKNWEPSASEELGRSLLK